MLVLFGLPGAGKSKAGSHVSKSRGFFHLEADFLQSTLSALDKFDTPNRFRIAFSDVCSLVRHNRHLSNSLLITGAMPEKWQWDLLESAAGEETDFRVVYLDCPIPVCLERIEAREGSDGGQVAQHSSSTLLVLSELYNALETKVFKNSIDATKSAEEIANQIEVFVDVG